MFARFLVDTLDESFVDPSGSSRWTFVATAPRSLRIAGL
jgi:hypothetical protein